MLLMCDGVAVLGSRHGMVWDPLRREAMALRFDRFTRMPKFQLRAGIRIGGEEFVFPLCREGRDFTFVDQRMTPCTMSLIGIHAPSATRVKLTVATPFRPRDAEFSTTPALALRLEAKTMPGYFRWTKKSQEVEAAELFLEIEGEAIAAETAGPEAANLRFDSVRAATWDGMADVWDTRDEVRPQHDRLVAVSGAFGGTRLSRTVNVRDGGTLDAAWCTWSEPVMEVRGEAAPFRYADRFGSLDAVGAWAREGGQAEILDNAAKVDGIVADNRCGASVNHLLAKTLHSWLLNTWWCQVGDREWFSVWEGTCYFHSTVDVEYTQTPFYLAVWPELLEIELDWWPEFSKPGEGAIGERGRGTAYLVHDMGAHSTANGMIYSHDMEVEEASNYILMAYAHWKRTGKDRILRKHQVTLSRYLDFIAACDSTGNGIPDLGVANTIDDASPAIQYGKEQMYLSVKALASFHAGAEVFTFLGEAGRAEACRARKERILATIRDHGWAGDHFATLLTRSGELKNPWTGEGMACAEIPGWDAPHIYTVNGLALLDMVGEDVGLDRDRIVRDLEVATARCLREYGCAHTDFQAETLEEIPGLEGLAGLAINPGWISMNLLRDIAAFYRGVDLRHLQDRYWSWQTLTNTQEPKLFFETFGGNNLCWYPRGVAAWGLFDALGGVVIDRVKGRDEIRPALPQIRVPRLVDADWRAGTATVIES